MYLEAKQVVHCVLPDDLKFLLFGSYVNQIEYVSLLLRILPLNVLQDF